jgi:hypothetical protein
MSSRTSPQQETKRSSPPPASLLPPQLPQSVLSSTVLLTAVSTVTLLGLARFYRRRLKRVPTAGHIEPGAYRSRTLLGRVTSVGDGDNFHLFHTPGGRLAGWGWLRRVPSSRAHLKNQTVGVSLLNWLFVVQP